MKKRVFESVVFLFVFCSWSACAFGAQASLAGKKVLVVNSYHATSGAELEIKMAIDQVLKGADLRYFFMDSKNHPENAEAKAEEAYALYLEFRPDAVISADDTAQALFVVPYLKDKVKTPIIFCGVNDDASQYGFPNSHITGILEKKHYREGINFVRLIDQRIQKIAVLYKENPSNDANISQIKREMGEYTVKISEFLAISDAKELTAILTNLHDTVDALLVLNLAGITDETGEKFNDNAAMTFVAERWKKPTIGASFREIEAGLLCGVAKLNTEQGLVAAKMVQDIFNGTLISDIPVTENRNGQRIINVSTARKLAIDLKPIVLIGTTLVQ